MNMMFRGNAFLATARERLRSNYWFVPSVMSFIAVALAFYILQVDREILKNPEREGWLYSGGVDGARALLSGVAGAALTLAAVVFSMNIVALVMTSQQFGPRLLANFIRDTGSQVTMGTFTSIFLFCLVILREVEGGGGEGDRGIAFVPHLAVSAAMGLAAVAFAVLIYYVHHIAVSIQAPVVVANVGLGLERTIKSEFPRRLDPGMDRSSREEHREERKLWNSFTHGADAVLAPASGYVQAVDYSRLTVLAARYDLQMRLEFRPGNFLIDGVPMLLVRPSGQLTKPLAKELRKCFYLGRRRTATQDMEYAIHELVEVAVRALSSAINDPYTAVTCIDWIAAGLDEIYQRDTPRGSYYDNEEVLRLVWRPVTHESVTDVAFNQIRQFGHGNASVLIRLLEAMIRIAPSCRNAQDRAILEKHAAMVMRVVRGTLPEPNDQQDAETRFKQLAAILAAGRPV